MTPPSFARPRARRAALSRGAAGVAACVALSGCTLLVDFVTKDSPRATCDGGDCLDASSAADGAPDTARSDAGPPVGDAAFEKSLSDARVDAAQCPNPCRSRDDGWYCGNNGLSCIAPADQLYLCERDAVADVTVCTSGCVPLPNGHPDTCDPCFGKANGTYCGKDLPIVPHVAGVDRNDIYLFDCKGGQTTTASQACPTACSGSPNAKCS